MKKLIIVLVLLFLVGCSTSKSYETVLKCIEGNEDITSIVTYNINKSKVVSSELEVTAKKTLFKNSSDELIEQELNELFKKVEIRSSDDNSISFITKLSKDPSDSLKVLDINYAQDAIDANDIEATSKFHSDNGGSCEVSSN